MKPERPNLPPWLHVSFRGARPRRRLRKLLRDLNLHTVCEGAACPNLCECWERGTATFMILGDTCTRNCQFCNVTHGVPTKPDPAEPQHITEAVEKLGLKYVVLTSVTRDDLPDFGAAHFAAVVNCLRCRFPHIGIEVLTPDFAGKQEPIDTVLASRPNVYNHNIETCARLSPQIRPDADYCRSLSVLNHAAHSSAASETLVKSGFMLGLGETAQEIHQLLADLKGQGVQILTIGQYLAPSSSHWPVDHYITPEVFEEWGRIAREEYGFSHVVSAPLVRSSYMAEQVAFGDANRDLQDASRQNSIE
ncbi:MAG: lipoyl synthase [Lentisphaeria bacterium]